MRASRAITTAALIGCLALVAGCGGSPSSTAGSAAASHGAEQGPYAFARCMRQHGLDNFPDPHVVTHDGQTSISQMLPKSAATAPGFRSAQKACQRFQPTPQNGPGPAAQQPPKQVLLAFARCLRAHGVSHFPDPNVQGQLTMSTISAAGVDLQAPSFLVSAKACIGVTHGAITMAQVQQAVSGRH